ncbi:uncharacterized protein HD556DRAFT_1314972 [Suillus plorans]|uniref:Protein kinase domain-containing protein n=1 Tax=Suillus plorans TaxID=116603 RepID=A0A9P7D8W8_9AGAM|nr:uncharacterized protein HD556DRAFT_1314972 [Suillus plorans]KAG1784560.1 hypothetical protein HD556DRAFT_1314972 [Suillus plorans]
MAIDPDRLETITATGKVQIPLRDLPTSVASPADGLLLFIEDIFLNLVARQIGSVSLDSIERSITGSGDSAQLNWSDYDEPGNKYTSGDIEHPLNLIYASYAAFLHLASGTLVDLRQFGDPILYLFVCGFVLFDILAWVDSGSVIPRRFLNTKGQRLIVREHLMSYGRLKGRTTIARQSQLSHSSYQRDFASEIPRTAWSIFKTRGSPNETNWPNVEPVELPHILPNSSSSTQEHEVDTKTRISPETMSPTPVNLINRSLVYEPSGRLRPFKALTHPWFTSEPPLLLPDDFSVSCIHGETPTSLSWGEKSLGEWILDVHPSGAI